MKDQDLILDLINTEAGRFLIGENGKERIVKITENSYHKLMGFDGKRPVIQAVFVYKFIEKIFTPIIEKQRIASEKYLDRILEDKYKSFLHFAGLKTSRYLPHVFLNTYGPTNSLYDATIGTDVRVSWASAHDATSGDSLNVNEGHMEASRNATPAYTIYRSGITWDTSSIGAGATLSAADIQLYPLSITDGGTVGADCVDFNPASQTSFVTGDFDQFGTTVFATKALSALTINQFSGNQWDIDATGRAEISVTGNTTFGFRITKDTANTSPTGTESNVVIFEENSGTNDPRLTVTYTLSSGGFFSLI